MRSVGLAHDGQADAGAFVFRSDESARTNGKFGRDFRGAMPMPLSLNQTRIEASSMVPAEISSMRGGSGRNKFCAIAQQVGDALGQKRLVADDLRQSPLI